MFSFLCKEKLGGKMKEKEKNQIVAFMILIITLWIGINVKNSSKGFLFDLSIMDFIHKNTSSIGLWTMKFISFFGSKYFFIIAGIIISIYFFNQREKRKAKLVVVSIVGSFIANITLKYIFTRIRPLNYMLIEHGGYSYPSGHTMVSTTFFLMMTYIMLEKITNKRNRKILIAGNIILIALIGFSRLYLGVHWPTDVLIGYLMGYLVFEIIKARVY